MQKKAARPCNRSARVARFPRMVLLAVVWAAMLGASHANAANDETSRDQNRLLSNVDAIKQADAARLPPLGQLQQELAHLWDAAAISRKPLAPQVVYSESNHAGYTGYKIEGIYINGAQVEAGDDRIYFYYARPKQPRGKLPVYIELTGGAKDEIANLWMAAALKCAVVHIEYRCTNARFRSKWAGYPRPGQPTPTMQELSSLRANFLYRMASGARRVIDYLAAQPEVDSAKIGCGGGSMGGYLTLLLAGVDARIAFGVDELGAGWKSAPQGSVGPQGMPAEYEALWSKAFNAYGYAARTEARIYVNLSANDAAFWLSDGLDNYLALAGEKRLGICPNDNHTAVSFGRDHWLPLFTWASYCIGAERDYPEITAVRAEGERRFMTVKDIAALKSASLYWSPGGKLAWPARYWQEISATLKDGQWQADIPAQYSRLAKCVFMSVVDVKGRRMSSPPTFTAGDDPRDVAGPLWAGEQLWDVRQGASAWRPPGGVAVRRGALKSQVAFSPPHGLTVGPEKTAKQFSLWTNSVILAAGHAKARQGLELVIDGRGKPGELRVSLVRDTGAVHSEEEFAHTLQYGPTKERYRIPWPEFTSAKSPGKPLLGFDGLRMDGARDDGSAITIDNIAFF